MVGFTGLPERSLILSEGAEVWGAGGGGHAPVETGARGPHAHPHASCLEAHGRVEAVGDRGPAHGAHHGAGGGEGSHGGALHVGRPRGVAQRHAI